LYRPGGLLKMVLLNPKVWWKGFPTTRQRRSGLKIFFLEENFYNRPGEQSTNQKAINAAIIRLDR
jgi:hypothetical protein